MEDENTFSTIAFMESRLQNLFYEDLDLLVHMRAQTFIIWLILFLMMISSQRGLKKNMEEYFGLKPWIIYAKCSQVQCSNLLCTM